MAYALVKKACTLARRDYLYDGPMVGMSELGSVQVMEVMASLCASYGADACEDNPTIRSSSSGFRLVCKPSWPSHSFSHGDKYYGTGSSDYPDSG